MSLPKQDTTKKGRVYEIYEMYRMYEIYKFNHDLSEGLPVINDTTNLSEGLPVINDTTGPSEGLPVINDTGAKLACVAYNLWLVWSMTRPG